jgi:hypothetical protein
LAQAGQPAAERQAEQEAKAALEESLRTARTELATRNQELAARIQQLGQLLEQLRKPNSMASATAEKPTSAPLPIVARPAAQVASPKAKYRRLYQVERWGLVALALAIVGAGGFGMARWLHPPKGKPLRAASHRPARTYQLREAPTPAPVIIYDTLLAAPQSEGDPGATRSPLPVDDEATTPALITPDTPLHVDSATISSEPTHLAAPTDSAAASPTP